MIQEKYIIYMDTGGTFSDAVIVRGDGSFITGKAPTTPDDLASCFFNCIEDAAAKMNRSLQQVLSQCAVLGFSTTAGTNALLTRTQEPRLGLADLRLVAASDDFDRVVARLPGVAESGPPVVAVLGCVDGFARAVGGDD